MKRKRELLPIEHGANVVIGVGALVFVVFLIIRLASQIFGFSPADLAPAKVAQFAIILAFLGFILRCAASCCKSVGDGSEEHF